MLWRVRTQKALVPSTLRCVVGDDPLTLPAAAHLYCDVGTPTVSLWWQLNTAKSAPWCVVKKLQHPSSATLPIHLSTHLSRTLYTLVSLGDDAHQTTRVHTHTRTHTRAHTYTQTNSVTQSLHSLHSLTPLSCTRNHSLMEFITRLDVLVQLWVVQDDAESHPALPTYVVKHLFGTRDDVMLDVCGRQLIERLAAAEVRGTASNIKGTPSRCACTTSVHVALSPPAA